MPPLYRKASSRVIIVLINPLLSFLGKFVLDINFVKLEEEGIREEFVAGRDHRSRGNYKHDGDHGCMKMCCEDQDFPIYVRISTQ